MTKRTLPFWSGDRLFQPSIDKERESNAFPPGLLRWTLAHGVFSACSSINILQLAAWNSEGQRRRRSIRRRQCPGRDSKAHRGALLSTKHCLLTTLWKTLTLQDNTATVAIVTAQRKELSAVVKRHCFMFLCGYRSRQ